MKPVFTYLSALAMMGFLSACATQAEKNVTQEVAQQKAIESPEQASHAGRFAIHFSEKLTADQKIKFMDLMNKTEFEVKNIKTQEGQLKAALFQSLANGKYNRSEVNVYKSKLKKLESQKMDLMFASLESVRQILGAPADMDPEMLNFYQSELNR